MAILLTMQVGPVDWNKFKAALDWARSIPAPGRKFSHVYRQQGDGSRVLFVEEWDSHDSMHKYQDQGGEEFNKRAGTDGMEWQDQVWELAESL